MKEDGFSPRASKRSLVTGSSSQRSNCCDTAPDKGAKASTGICNEFPQFSRLPNELRLQIWREARPGTRLVEILYEVTKSAANKPKVFVYSPTPAPVILFVNHESREEGLRSYLSVYTPTPSPKPRSINHEPEAEGFRAYISDLVDTHCLSPIYFDCTEDIAYFPGFFWNLRDQDGFIIMLSIFKDFNLGADQRLNHRIAIHLPSDLELMVRSRAAVALSWYKSLKEIIMITNSSIVIQERPLLDETCYLSHNTESSEDEKWQRIKSQMLSMMDFLHRHSGINDPNSVPKFRAGKFVAVKAKGYTVPLQRVLPRAVQDLRRENTKI